MPRQNTKVTTVKPISSPVIVTRNNNTLFSSIKEGFGFSIGSMIARNLFSSTSTHIPSSNNLYTSQISCIEYKKCLESDDKYECFGNLDQKEYVNCRTNIEK